MQRKQERHTAAEGVTDERDVVQVAILDQLCEQLRLVQGRIAFIEGLVGLAEAFEVDGNDVVVARKLRSYASPSEGVGAEAMDEQHGRAIALFCDEKMYRRVRRTKAGKRAVARLACAEPAGAERKRDRRKTKRR